MVVGGTACVCGFVVGSCFCRCACRWLVAICVGGRHSASVDQFASFFVLVESDLFTALAGGVGVFGVSISTCGEVNA